MRIPWSKPDAQVVRQVLGGDREAFGALVERHFRMACAVAYAYTSSHADADDAVQEAFLRAYRSLDTLRQPARFGPWLAQIVRNASNTLLAERHRQAELSSRAALEQQAVIPDPGRIELHRIVRAKIETLDAPHREVLLLHYYAGKRVREIALLLEATPEAVRKRLQRAREALGETLLADIGAVVSPEEPESKRVRTVLAAVSAAPSPSTSGATAAGVSTGLALKLALGGGVACAILVAVWISQAWQARDNATPRASAAFQAVAPPSSVAPAAPDAAPAPDVVAAASDPTDTTNAAPGEETGECLIVCEVVGPDGSPQPGVDVLLARRPGEWTFPGAPRLQRQGRTNAKGEVFFDRLPDGTYTQYARTADAVAAGETETGARFPFGRQRLVLEPAARITGAVRDEQGRLVPDARILQADCRPKPEQGIPGLYRQELGRTDDEGRFDLALPRRMEWRFHVKAEGYATGETGWLSGKAPAEVVLTPGATVQARVEPAQPVRMRLSSTDVPEDRYESNSDTAGLVTFEHLRPGTYLVEVEDPHWAVADAKRTVQVGPEGLTDLVVMVEPGGEIAGRVVDGDTQEAVAEALVRAGARFAKTDADGRYRITGLASDEYAVLVQESGEYNKGADRPRQYVKVQAGQGPFQADFAANAGGGRAVVQGRVLTDAGQPVPGAFVSASLRSGMEGATVVRAQSDGTYQVAGLPVTADLELRAFYPGLASRNAGPLTVTADGLSDVDLTCERTGSLSGKIACKSGRPFGVEDTNIQFINAWHTFARIYTAMAVLKGGFRIPDLPPGEYQLDLDLPLYRNRTGWPTPEAVVNVGPGQEVTGVVLDFDDVAYRQQLAESRGSERRMQQDWEERRAQAVGVRGEVLDARTGAPVTEYSLTLGNTHHGANEHEEGKFSEDDVFSLGPVAAVCVWAPHYAPQRVPVSVEQADDKYVNLVIRLEPGAVVEGVVLGDGDRPVEGARLSTEPLTLDTVPGQETSLPSTGPDGSFRLDTLESRTQRVYVEHPSYAMTAVDVNPAQAGPVTIRLSHGGTVEGLVTLGGRPVPGARLSCYNKQGPRRDRLSKTGADGRYTLANVLSGPFSVAVFLPKGDPLADIGRYQVREVEVTEGGVVREDFAFGAAGARVQGSITYVGAPAERPSVSVGMLHGGGRERLEGSVEIDGHAYRTPLLPPGELQLDVRVQTPGGSSLCRRLRIPIQGTETLVQDIDFPAGVALSGLILGLRPREDVIVAALPGDVPAPDEAVINPGELLMETVAQARAEDGVYRLEDLAPGRYTIRVVSLNGIPGGEPPRVASAVVTVTEGQEQTLDLTLD